MRHKADLQNVHHLDELYAVMADHRLDAQGFCVVGSAALAIHGLAENRDIDILVAPLKRQEMGLAEDATRLTEHVEVVGKDWAKRLRHPDDAFFSDPALTIEVEGIRFARPEIVFNKNLLSKRPKDRTSVHTVERYLAADPGLRAAWDWDLLWLPADDSWSQPAAAATVSQRALRVMHTGVRAARRPDLAIKEIARRATQEPKAVHPVPPLLPLLVHRMQTAALLHCQYMDDDFSRLDLIVRYLAMEATESGDDASLGPYARMQQRRGRGNPRRDLGALIDSFREHGFLDRHPLPVTKDGRLIDGAHRLACALYTGVQEVPVTIEPETRPLSGYGRAWFIENGFEPTFMRRVEETRDRVFEQEGVFFPVVLWPGVTPWLDEIVATLARDHRVVWSRRVDLGDHFGAFVRDIYRVDDIDWWKVERKIHAMTPHGGTIGVVLLEVPRPGWRSKTRSHAPIAQAAELLKRQLRGSYRARVPGYVYDTVCHVGDNHEHNRQVLQAMRRHGTPDGGK